MQPTQQVEQEGMNNMAAIVTAAKAMLVQLGLSDAAASEITDATGQNTLQIEDFLNWVRLKSRFCLDRYPFQYD
jgi:hypothetical protein